MDLVEALRTTGAVREFEDRPVDREVMARVLDTARFAPNGGNQQSWHVVLVEDPATRSALRALYVPGWLEYLEMRKAGVQPWAPVGDRDAEAAAVARAHQLAGGEAAAAAGGFAAAFDQVPVMAVILADLRLLAATDRDLGRYTLVGGASVYPFVWSILLAARAEGLGGVVTTMTTTREPEVRDLLRVPDEFALAAVLALGYPVKRPQNLRRDPVESFATVDAFDGPPVVSP
ncbi:MAG TPA: nitroreductase family protein [Acidimicrobiales bacterium]|nr:nitroreductase family protein [Acidimicrobiales bacterium]